MPSSISFELYMMWNCFTEKLDRFGDGFAITGFDHIAFSLKRQITYCFFIQW